MNRGELIEGKVKQAMRAIGIHATPIENISKVVILLKDGCYLEFQYPQVIKMTMCGKTSYQIRGEPRQVDTPNAFKFMFGG